tara:strand:- start:535 stop:993 length:459 start_codon:yes stop_codon:yes gene_type:complete
MKNSRGTEININEYPHLNVVFGSIDKNNPKTLYVKISAWGKTIDYDSDTDYGSVIRQINKKIRTISYKEIDNSVFNKDMNMVYLDIRESGILDDKPSFMSCEITLQQNNNYLITSELIDNALRGLTSHIINGVFLINKHFKFYKNKVDTKNI